MHLRQLPTIPPNLKNMHYRKEPRHRQITPSPLHQNPPTLHLPLQPLHPPLLQMPPPLLSPPCLRRHPKPQRLLLQRHHRCIRERIANSYRSPTVRQNSPTGSRLVQHPHFGLCRSRGDGACCWVVCRDERGGS